MADKKLWWRGGGSHTGEHIKSTMKVEPPDKNPMVEKHGFKSFWFLFGICLEVGATEYIKGTMKVDKKWIEVVA